MLLLAALAFGCAGTRKATILSVSDPPLGDEGQLTRGLGVSAVGGNITTVLPQGCSLPCDSTFDLRTTRDGQERVSLSFHTVGKRTTSIGGIQIVGIPRAPAGEREVAVTIRAAKEKLTVKALEKQSGEPLEVRTLLDVAP